MSQETLLVRPDYLLARLQEPTLKIIETPKSVESYARAHIPGARCRLGHSYLKALDEAGERTPHVLEAQAFEALAAQLGICSDDEVIVYDDFHGLFATRLWWVFRYYGFERIRVLDGGWQGWLEHGYPASSLASEFESGSDLQAKPQAERIIRLEELRQVCEQDDTQVWDTRRLEEYDGSGESSNKRLGHIPGASHLEWKDLLEEATAEGGARYFRSPEAIQALLEQSGLKSDQLTITHCQAGIRGAFGSFILELLDWPKHRLYDASMAEWANEDDTPLERGS